MSNFKKTIIITINDIDSIVEKEDAVIVYLKNGKYWVCETIKEIRGVYKLTLKGKSDR